VFLRPLSIPIPVTGRAAITDLPGFSGRSAIKFRGSSTLLFAKKSLSLESGTKTTRIKMFLYWIAFGVGLGIVQFLYG